MNNRIYFAAMIVAPIAAVAAPAPTTPSAYVAAAGAGDLYEVQSSRLVLASTGNAKLKSFANMMVADHTKSTADVKAAATASGLTPKPPVLDPAGSKNLAALKAVNGAARDKLYVVQQRAAHQKALALHQGYANAGTAPALKQTAAQIVPAVKHHIEMLASM